MSELMSTSNLLQHLRRKEQRGSKSRCHFMTHGEPHEVAGRLTSLIHPWGYVAATDSWMPKGFYDTEEAQLHKAKRLIPSQNDRDVLKSWWLADPRPTSTTPSWDIASTCSIKVERGLLLVEAKAHEGELRNEACGKRLRNVSSKANHESVARAIADANEGLARATKTDWRLSSNHCYQMSNRFAWSWKLCTLGYAVILVYLGFLDAADMDGPFGDDTQWDLLVKDHSAPLFPPEMWDRTINIGTVTFLPLIRASTQSLND
jgi:hypothetical protein